MADIIKTQVQVSSTLNHHKTRVTLTAVISPVTSQPFKYPIACRTLEVMKDSTSCGDCMSLEKRT